MDSKIEYIVAFVIISWTIDRCSNGAVASIHRQPTKLNCAMLCGRQGNQEGKLCNCDKLKLNASSEDEDVPCREGFLSWREMQEDVSKSSQLKRAKRCGLAGLRRRIASKRRASKRRRFLDKLAWKPLAPLGHPLTPAQSLPPLGYPRPMLGHPLTALGHPLGQSLGHPLSRSLFSNRQVPIPLLGLPYNTFPYENQFRALFPHETSVKYETKTQLRKVRGEENGNDVRNSMANLRQSFAPKHSTKLSSHDSTKDSTARANMSAITKGQTARGTFWPHARDHGLAKHAKERHGSTSVPHKSTKERQITHANAVTSSPVACRTTEAKENNTDCRLTTSSEVENDVTTSKDLTTISGIRTRDIEKSNVSSINMTHISSNLNLSTEIDRSGALEKDSNDMHLDTQHRQFGQRLQEVLDNLNLTQLQPLHDEDRKPPFIMPVVNHYVYTGRPRGEKLKKIGANMIIEQVTFAPSALIISEIIHNSHNISEESGNNMTEHVASTSTAKNPTLIGTYINISTTNYNNLNYFNDNETTDSFSNFRKSFADSKQSYVHLNNVRDRHDLPTKFQLDVKHKCTHSIPELKSIPKATDSPQRMLHSSSEFRPYHFPEKLLDTRQINKLEINEGSVILFQNISEADTIETSNELDSTRPKPYTLTPAYSKPSISNLYSLNAKLLPEVFLNSALVVQKLAKPLLHSQDTYLKSHHVDEMTRDHKSVFPEPDYNYDDKDSVRRRKEEYNENLPHYKVSSNKAKRFESFGLSSENRSKSNEVDGIPQVSKVFILKNLVEEKANFAIPKTGKLYLHTLSQNEK